MLGEMSIELLSITSYAGACATETVQITGLTTRHLLMYRRDCANAALIWLANELRESTCHRLAPMVNNNDEATRSMI